MMRLPTKALFSLLLISSTHIACAADVGLQDLMQMLSQKKSGTATYVEKKYIALLDKPVESSGELSFTAPDHLEKRTLKPKAESVILDGNKLQLERADGRRLSVNLADRPEVATFVESIRATLTGDRNALERYYSVALKGPIESWQLTLVPLQPKMQKIIRQIRIAGLSNQVKTIEFMQADGDHSEMSITSTTAK